VSVYTASARARAISPSSLADCRAYQNARPCTFFGVLKKGRLLVTMPKSMALAMVWDKESPATAEARVWGIEAFTRLR